MTGRTVALVVAAGEGSRAGGAMPKQYAMLAGAPLLTHALRHLRHDGIDAVRVVIGAGQEAAFRHASAGFAVGAPIIGGVTRRESVRNGLETLAAEGGIARVLIHDAARPFLPGAVIERLLAALDEGEDAVPALPMVDSLARGGEALGEAVPRDGLLRIQTPQAFHFAPILAAHRAWNGADEATDDAQVARAHGMDVGVVAGHASLEKLTHREDFRRAEEQLSGRLVTRVGTGFDVHAFADGEDLWLGGLSIPHHRGLKGHSDADVLLHAITDALLGAIGDGDIGSHFPPSDPQWKGASSARFLEHARDLVTARGGRIDHIDATLICEAPRIGPHRDALRASVAALLQLSQPHISIKATTTERLGFTGRGEGIAVQAVATVRMPEGE